MFVLIKVEVPKWRWDDPFGRNTIRRVCYDLEKALCDAEGYKVERDEILKAKSEACDGLAAHINDALALARTLDDMRKQLAAANRELRRENEMLHKDNEHLTVRLAELKRDYDELDAEHERVIRGLTDKEAEV